NFADLLSQRLTIAQEGRATQNVDLRACIVDDIFLGNLVAGKGKQVGQGVAHDRTAAMADMHGPGWVGGNIFNVDLAAAADLRTAVTCSSRKQGRKMRLPECIRQPQVDETG